MTVRSTKTREGKATSSRRPATSCRDCGFASYSAMLARGLRLLGSCPRCAGRLRFAAHEATAHDCRHSPLSV